MNDDDEIEVEADDLGAQIRAAAEQVTKDKLSSADVASYPEADVPEDGARARDASGKFISKSAVEQTETVAPVTPTTDADQKTEQPVQQSSAATPPSFLPAEAKSEWAKTPSAIQAALIKRDVDANEGARQWSEQRRNLEQAISPLHELSQQNGIPWQEGLNRLLTVETNLRNPQTAAQTIGQLAQAYGVDLAALVNGSPQPQRQVQQPQFDPNAIRQDIRQTIAAEFEERALNSTISEFGLAKDANGNLLHPHFEAVKAAMGFLLSSEKAQSMQDAYDKAIWLDPSMRPQPQIQVNSQQQVQKARKAAVSVSGAPVNGVSKPKGFDPNQSLVDDIREAAAMHRH